jgi:hypothetical protein
MGQAFGLRLTGSRIYEEFGPLREAKNVSLTGRGTITNRPGTQLYANVHEESVGLYTANGQLRTLIPAGDTSAALGIKQLEPDNIVYDRIAVPAKEFDADGNQTGGMTRLHDSTTFNVDADGAAIPYVVVELTSGQSSHHYMDYGVVAPTEPVNTVVELGFVPGTSIAKVDGKLYCPDYLNGVVRFSGALLPRDWQTPRDAGFLATNQHAYGDRRIVAVDQYEGQLVAMYPNSAQFWAVDPVPGLNQMIRAVKGPGTKAPQSLENVSGDLFYFSEGGFRSMLAQVVTGQPKPDDLGDDIEPLTRGEVADENTVALWSEARSSYLCSFPRESSTTVYVYRKTTVLDESQSRGWTTWELPFRVEYLVENDGVLYARDDQNRIWKFTDDCDTDEVTGQKVEWTWRTQQIVGKSWRDLKSWDTFDVVQDGTAQFDFVFSADDSEIVPGPTIVGDSIDGGWVPINDSSVSIGIRASGTGAYEFQALAIDYSLTRAGLR